IRDAVRVRISCIPPHHATIPTEEKAIRSGQLNRPAAGRQRGGARTREVKDGPARSPVIAGLGLAEIARLVQRASRLRGRVRDSRPQHRGVRDDADLTVFLYETEVAPCPGIPFTIQVDDVDAKHQELSAAA